MIYRWWDRFRYLGPGRASLLAGLVSVYLLSLLFFLIAPAAYREPAPWGAFVPVATDRDPADAQELLTAEGIAEVVTEHTSDVIVTRFSHLEALSLSAALNQLDPLDPRRDPYIRGLGRYFHLEPDGRSLIYLRTDRSPGAIARMVRRVLGPGSTAAGHAPGRTIAAFVIFAAGLAVAVLWGVRYWRFVLGGALPLVPLVAGAGIAGGVAGAVLLIAWSRALQDIEFAMEREVSHSGIPPAVLRAAAWLGLATAGSIALVWFMTGPGPAITVVPSAAGMTAVTVAYFMLQLGGSVHRDHELFAPVSILSMRMGRIASLALRGRPVAIIASVAVLVVLPFVAARLTSSGDLAVPRPTSTGTADDISFESVAAMWLDDNAEGLPDASDYLAHRAYQESLAYGRGYSPPYEGEAVALSRFRETATGAYSRFSENVLVFDDDWLARTLADVPRGISSMIVSGGGTSGVVLTLERGLYSGYPQVLIHIAYVLLALTPAVLSGRRVPRFGRGRSKVVEIARRRKQVA